jgi:hypothetical protein
MKKLIPALCLGLICTPAIAKVDTGYAASEFFADENFEYYNEVETYYINDTRAKLYSSGMAYGTSCPNAMTLVVGKRAYNIGNCSESYKVKEGNNKLVFTFDKSGSAPKEQFVYQNGKVTSKTLK